MPAKKTTQPATQSQSQTQTKPRANAAATDAATSITVAKAGATKTPAPKKAAAATTAVTQVSAAAGGEAALPKKKAPRRVVTADLVKQNLEKVIENLDVEIKQIKDANEKSKGNTKTRGFRTLHKQLSEIRKDMDKLFKQKNRTRQNKNSESGFMKPVDISAEMAGFLGVPVSEKRSRVQVTQAICKWVKDKKLQKESDRRQINPDSTLCSLLKYDPKSAEVPLTYYHLQKLIQPHFISTSATTAVAATAHVAVSAAQ